MKLKALNWLRENNGTIIKRTLIGAGSIIGLALLSGLTVSDGENTDGYTEVEIDPDILADEDVIIETEETTPESEG